MKRRVLQRHRPRVKLVLELAAPIEAFFLSMKFIQRDYLIAKFLKAHLKAEPRRRGRMR